MTSQLFTIGHSTHSLDLFLELLNQHGVNVLADIRRFPSSRKFPHFNRENLTAALSQAGIEYHWLEALGGRRKTTNNSSENMGLRNESFRNYADYMLTAEFRAGIAKLLTLAGNEPTAYMCSESVFWRCHRRLVSDYLLAHDVLVQHIMPNGDLRPHTLTEGAKVAGKKLTYPAAVSEQGRLFE